MNLRRHLRGRVGLLSKHVFYRSRSNTNLVSRSVRSTQRLYRKTRQKFLHTFFIVTQGRANRLHHYFDVAIILWAKRKYRFSIVFVWIFTHETTFFDIEIPVNLGFCASRIKFQLLYLYINLVFFHVYLN